MKMAYLKEFDVDVNEDGEIFNARSGRKFKATTDKHGYCRITLTKPDGKRGGLFVHRAIALAFIPNPENKPDVNHMDGNKSNNALSNLEWATRGENMRHAKNTGLWNRRMGIEHVGSRNKIIANLYSMGVNKEIIGKAFELNDFVINQAIRVSGN